MAVQRRVSRSWVKNEGLASKKLTRAAAWGMLVVSHFLLRVNLRGKLAPVREEDARCVRSEGRRFGRFGNRYLGLVRFSKNRGITEGKEGT